MKKLRRILAALFKGTGHAFHAYMPLSVSLAGIGEPVACAKRVLDELTCDVLIVKPSGVKSRITRQKS